MCLLSIKKLATVTFLHKSSKLAYIKENQWYKENNKSIKQGDGIRPLKFVMTINVSLLNSSVNRKMDI